MLDSNITTAFFQLSNIGQLCDFVESLDRSSKVNNAFAAFIDRWVVRMMEIGQDRSFPFDPNKFLSTDLSCIHYGTNPIIFLGTNEWAVKRQENFDYLASKTDVFAGRAQFLANNANSKLSFVVVPEKDIIMDKIAGRTSAIENIDKAMARIQESCDSMQLPFIYDGFVADLPMWASEDDYGFADSHLLTRDYLGIFLEVMHKWGFDGRDVAGDISLYADILYSDFGTKFKVPLNVNDKYLYPRFSNNAAELTQGHETFATPLGETVQKLYNPKAKIDATLEIFGDSHSSILSTRKMTYMFSSAFKNCTFYWNPWGVRQEQFETNSDFAIVEISQRFVF